MWQFMVARGVGKEGLRARILSGLASLSHGPRERDLIELHTRPRSRSCTTCSALPAAILAKQVCSPAKAGNGHGNGQGRGASPIQRPGFAPP